MKDERARKRQKGKKRQYKEIKKENSQEKVKEERCERGNTKWFHTMFECGRDAIIMHLDCHRYFLSTCFSTQPKHWMANE